MSLDADAELTNESTFTARRNGIHSRKHPMAGGGGGGHGGGGGSMAADLSWTNESSQYTATVGTTPRRPTSTRPMRTEEEIREQYEFLEEELASQALRATVLGQEQVATQNGTSSGLRVEQHANPAHPVARDPET